MPLIVTTFDAQFPVTPEGSPLKLTPVAPVVAYVILVSAVLTHTVCASVPTAELNVIVLSALTVTAEVVLLQVVVASVKVKVTLPAETAVTRPALVTVAKAGLLLDHVPPVVGLRVSVEPIHKLAIGAFTTGSAFLVMFTASELPTQPAVVIVQVSVFTPRERLDAVALGVFALGENVTPTGPVHVPVSNGPGELPDKTAIDVQTAKSLPALGNVEIGKEMF